MGKSLFFRTKAMVHKVRRDGRIEVELYNELNKPTGNIVQAEVPGRLKREGFKIRKGYMVNVELCTSFPNKALIV